MRRLLTLFLLIGAASLLFASPTPVSACSCAERQGTAEQWLAGAAAIFTGSVTDISERGYTYDVTFNVGTSWKGYFDTAATVRTSQNSASCGYTFEVGEEYIVFASGDEQLETGICSRTALLANAQSDVDALNAVTGGYVSPESDDGELATEVSQPSIKSNMPTVVIGVIAFSAGAAVAYAVVRRSKSF